MAPWLRRRRIEAAIVICLAALGACRQATPTAIPPPTATPTASPRPSLTASPRPTVTPTFPADAFPRVDALHLRAGPDVLHPVLGVISRATPMEITGRDHLGDWYAVRLPDGSRGWVNGHFVARRPPVESIPTVPTPTAPPTPTATAVPMDPALPIVLSPPAVAAGDPVLVRARAPARSRALALLGNTQVELFAVGDDRLAGLLAVGLEIPWGVQPVHVTLIDPVGETSAFSVPLTVNALEVPEQNLAFRPEAESLLDAELLRREMEQLAPLWATVTPLRLWEGPWARPMQGAISSPFGARRTYGPGGPPSLHSGVDLRAPFGTPVLAPAPGQVLLAETLAARGNAVLVDHGWGVISGYFHLSSIAVTSGEVVATGQPLGTVGATGLATGPHLHWEVRIRGIPAQPLQFLLRDVGAVP